MKFEKYIEYTHDTLQKLDFEQINKLYDLICEAYNNNKMIYVIGNGGSAANASHFAQDLTKGTRSNLEQGKRIKALSLTDNLPFITALGNDDGFDTIFEQQLRSFANAGDYLIAISGSGNSPNIIKAAEWANNNGLETIGVTGFSGGKLKEINKYSVYVPLNDMATVESIHSIIFHYIILKLSEKMKII
jgi:D-sedoheptulose 7-phosphate isomerase